MLEIDGSQGEGGGQVLRSALTLSLLTGKPFELKSIRARRPKPGLAAQHLAAVNAAARIGGAAVEGAELGSRRLSFRPGRIRSGNYRFEIGTAGSAPLLVQAVLPPLWGLGDPSTVQVGGGTHVPWSPCYHYLEWVWLFFLRRIGLRTELELKRAGFYPRGGGSLRARILSAGKPRPLVLVARGELLRIRGLSAVAKLDRSIAERQRRRAFARLEGRSIDSEIEVAQLEAASPGSVLVLLAEFENSRACFFALGARGKRAERVADEAVDELQDFLHGDGVIDPYLADQLVVPLALAEGASEFTTSRLSRHLATNAAVVRRFLSVEIRLEETETGAGRVVVAGRPAELESGLLQGWAP
jgi:RNA 3'-terminal phosphate cyclase (ATP)